MADTNGVGHMSGILQAHSMMLSITANDLEKSVRFYTEGLGFEVGERNEVDGVVQFVSLYSGSVRIGIGRDDFAKGRDRAKGVGMRVWISTEQDVTELAARAKAAGAPPEGEPETMPWGPLAVSFTDPDGFKITIVNDG